MRHILNFAFDFEDDKIKEKLVESAEQQVIESIKKDILEIFKDKDDSNFWNHDPKNGLECWVKRVLDDYIVEPWAEKAADYLLNNGVIVPPCKVGDTVYIIPSKVSYEINKLHKCEYLNDVYENEIVEIRKNRNRIYCIAEAGNFDDTMLVDDFFGDTWFLTREEAEQALKERETK